MEHALLVLETVIGKSIDWNFDLWMASLDFRKAFDKIGHDSLFGALRAQGVPPEYVDLLATFYQNQTGAVEGSMVFPIQRGVKQGDVLSPALFNAGFEEAIYCWKRRLTTHGFDVGAQERLTNERYADDLLVYAKSLPELVCIIELLCEELGKVGLQSNGAKIKIHNLFGRVCGLCSCQWRRGGNIEVRCCSQIFGPKIVW